jgi:hypothetical protein
MILLQAMPGNTARVVSSGVEDNLSQANLSRVSLT